MQPLDLWTALALAGRPGPARLQRLVEVHGGVRGLADAVWAGRLDPDDRLEAGDKAPALQRALRDTLAPASLRRARARADAWRKAGLLLVHPDHPRYPPLLAAIHDPPALLFVRGRLPAGATAPWEASRAVAVVGTRRASPWAERFATRLGRELAEAGVVVVSGLALGVDGAAHRGALEADAGLTVAVLGSGLDRVHPPAHRDLAREVAERGAVMSEDPPDVTARRSSFPRRNRIIAGIARAVVVVEAAERSGALITARLANDEGRDVATVPQRPDTRTGQIALAWAREGALSIGSADDLLRHLAWRTAAPAPPVVADPLQRRLLDRLRDRSDGAPPDDVAGASPGAVLAALTELELAGLVRRDGRGGWRPA